MQNHVISNELLAILVCPENKSSLALASTATVDKVNSLIAEGKLQNRSGQQISNPVEAGLIREDSKILYPIVDGIPIMLVEEGIVVENLL